MRSLSSDSEMKKVKRLDSDLLCETYDDFGWVLIKGLVCTGKLEKLRSYISDVMAAGFAESIGVVQVAELDLDNAFQVLDLDDKQILRLISLVKNSVPFFSIMVDENIMEAVKLLQKSNHVHCVHDIAQFRIDPYERSPRLFGWHQDYPYNQTSIDAITAWIPLTTVDLSVGPIELIPASQNAEVVVKHCEGKKQNIGDTNKVIEFELPGNLLEQAVTAPHMDPGDVLFFHSKLLHRSGTNVNKEACRWICNPRYSNSMDKELVSRKWLSVTDRNVGTMIEEYVAKLSK